MLKCILLPAKLSARRHSLHYTRPVRCCGVPLRGNAQFVFQPFPCRLVSNTQAGFKQTVFCSFALDWKSKIVSQKLTPAINSHIQCESKKSPPLQDLTFFHFLHKRLRICNRFFTHLLNVAIFARLQIFIQLSPIWTKLYHIKRDYAVHIICAKCPKRTKTREFRRLRKSLIALLIVVCGKSL